jgi:hypothetical protein
MFGGVRQNDTDILVCDLRLKMRDEIDFKIRNALK